MIVDHRLQVFGVTAQVFLKLVAHVLGHSFVNPHVASGFAGYQVAKPMVRQFVGNQILALQIAVYRTARVVDAGGVFHRPCGGDCKPNFLPEIRAESGNKNHRKCFGDW